MSDKPAAPATGKSGGMNKIMLIVVALASLGGGAAMPMLMAKSKSTATEDDHGHGDSKKKKSAHGDAPVSNVSFGDVVVNLADDRMSRFLRIKIILKIEGVAEEKGGGHGGGGHGGGGGGSEVLAPFKPTMKNWLIGHLAGKSLKEISGTMGVKKLQREILEKFEEIMAAEQASHAGHGSSSTPKAHMHLKEVLFEEYVVQ